MIYILFEPDNNTFCEEASALFAPLQEPKRCQPQNRTVLFSILNVKPEVHDVSILHDISFPFNT
jgi:hypothetical protein